MYSSAQLQKPVVGRSNEAGTVRAKERSLPLTKVLRALKIWGDHTGLG